MLNDLNIEYLSPAGLKPRPNNPRTYSQKQIRQVVRSIEKLGFNSPVLIDDENGIVAGHARVEVATSQSCLRPLGDKTFATCLSPRGNCIIFRHRCCGFPFSAAFSR
ncbi:ParB N-terminal domain-containing protein [Desertibaculum subflavum]|uniref:ParB N-terminal domain-containing protein n=1 Tax=Desertibaculum subflavum TaxID=2268458 RepID=UPI000E673AAF